MDTVWKIGYLSGLCLKLYDGAKDFRESHFMFAQLTRAFMHITFCSSSQTCKLGERDVAIICVLRRKTNCLEELLISIL